MLQSVNTEQAENSKAIDSANTIPFVTMKSQVSTIRKEARMQGMKDRIVQTTKGWW